MSEHPLSVAVLAGGLSLEREVSLRSGQRVADALTDRGHDVTHLDIDANLVSRLVAADVDVAFIALHGAAGEDGTVQSMLELLDIPHTGPDVLASSLAWNKPIAQGLYARAGVRVPRNVVLSATAFREMGAAAAVDRVVSRLGPRVVVKPATSGSSLGLTDVTDPATLPAAIVTALSYADRVLVETHVTGTEVAVSLLDGAPLPPVEIDPRGGVYDFAARYTAGATDFHVPARLGEDVLEACRTAATTAAAAIGARRLARADLIVDADGTPWLLELDTSPGLTDTSLLPVAARAAGISFPDLCERLLTSALATGATS